MREGKGALDTKFSKVEVEEWTKVGAMKETLTVKD